MKQRSNYITLVMIFLIIMALGCRNVSKMLVPKIMILIRFLNLLKTYQPIIHHHKYNNNYDYNKSIYLVNSDKHFDNGFLMVKEDERLASPLAVFITVL
jgi:hypothetical protein